MTAIAIALEHVTTHLEQNPQEATNRKIWVISDSQSTISIVSTGPGNQYGDLGNKIWGWIMRLTQYKQSIRFQWIPGHRQIQANEEADTAAGEASKLQQADAPIDFSTIKAAVKRHIKEKDEKGNTPNTSFHYQTTQNRPKKIPASLSRKEEVLIHQLRCGKSPLVANCLYKYLGLTEDHGLCIEGCREKETV